MSHTPILRLLLLSWALGGPLASLAAQNDSTGSPGGLSLMLMLDQHRNPYDRVEGLTLRGIGIRREGITTAFGVGVVGRGVLSDRRALEAELGFGASGAGRRVALLFTGGAVGLFPLEGNGLGALGVSVGGAGIVGITGRLGLRLDFSRRIYIKTGVPNSWVIGVGVGLVPGGDWRRH